MSCKMNSNRAYIHGYCSSCKRFFNSFFLSPLSNCNRLARGRSQHHHQTQRHHQTPQPSTEKYPKINRNPKINPPQNQPNRYNSTQRQPHRPTGNPSKKTHMKNPTETHMKNPPENLLDLPRFATDLPPICSCGSELRIGTAVDRYL